MLDAIVHATEVELVVRILSARGVSKSIRRQALSAIATSCLPEWQDYASNIASEPDGVEWIAPTGDSLACTTRLGQMGVKVLLRGDASYPQCLQHSLGDQAPDVLFACGNLGLLNCPSVGFCGARNASPGGLEVAGQCAQLLSWRGFNVVSGYAKGVDSKVHKAAWATGATTTIVLAEGILEFAVKEEMRDVFDLDRTLVLSQFSPGLHWQTWQAMTRNLTILGLSDALVVIEAGDSGGTLAAGEAALKRGVPVFVVDQPDHPKCALGNRRLIANGAKPLRVESSHPDLAELLATVERVHLNEHRPCGPLFA